MSILRKQQIQQVLDDENIYKRQVLSRINTALKGYQQSVLPAQIIDVDIVDNNKRSILNFVSMINELYLILRHTEDKLFELLTGHPSEYRRYLTLLNITKYYTAYEQLMKEYNNLNLNMSTKDQMKNNLTKIESYATEIIRLLKKNISILSTIWLFQFNGQSIERLMTIAPNLRTEEHMILEDIHRLYEKIKHKVLSIDSIQLLKEHIETLAFFLVLDKQYQRNKYDSVTADDISFEITAIIKEIRMGTGNRDLELILTRSFDKLLPEIAPYFKNGFDQFKEQRDELNRQNMPPEYDDNDDGEAEYVPQQYGPYRPYAPITDDDNATQYSRQYYVNPPIRRFGPPQSNELQRLHALYRQQPEMAQEGTRTHASLEDTTEEPSANKSTDAGIPYQSRDMSRPQIQQQLERNDYIRFTNLSTEADDGKKTSANTLNVFIRKYDNIRLLKSIIHYITREKDKKYLDENIDWDALREKEYLKDNLEKQDIIYLERLRRRPPHATKRENEAILNSFLGYPKDVLDYVIDIVPNEKDKAYLQKHRLGAPKGAVALEEPIAVAMPAEDREAEQRARGPAIPFEDRHNTAFLDSSAGKEEEE